MTMQGFVVVSHTVRVGGSAKFWGCWGPAPSGQGRGWPLEICFSPRLCYRAEFGHSTSNPSYGGLVKGQYPTAVIRVSLLVSQHCWAHPRRLRRHGRAGTLDRVAVAGHLHGNEMSSLQLLDSACAETACVWSWPARPYLCSLDYGRPRRSVFTRHRQTSTALVNWNSGWFRFGARLLFHWAFSEITNS